MLDSNMSIDQRLARLYVALDELDITGTLASMKPTTVVSGNRFSTSVDFTKVTDEPTAENRVNTLINNIACLKDHLHLWCRNNGKPETGDLLIDSNQDVAIIHDLWNLDKHAELNRRSRSNLSPRLQPAHSTLEFKIASTEETPLLMMSAFGGQFQTFGDPRLRITGTVVDKDGNTLGDVEEICLRAIDAWEAEIVRAGAAIPPFS
jgi:hypothetical protein